MAGVPKLIILTEQFRGVIFALTRKEYVLGRADEQDICIRDSTVSKNHCRLIEDGNTYTVEDLGSTNGTRINNALISSRTALQDGDYLQVGGVELLYDCEGRTYETPDFVCELTVSA